MHIPGVVHRRDIARRTELGIDPSLDSPSGPYRVEGAWLVSDEAPEALVGFLKAGLRPGCVDAAAAAGLFVPPLDGAHACAPRRGPAEELDLQLVPMRQVFVPKGAQKPRLPVRLHGPVLSAWPDMEPIPSIPLILEQVARCLGVPDAAIVIESALRQRMITRGALDSVLQRLPRDQRRALSRVRSDADSGTETKVRWWLESQGVKVRSQVHIGGVGCVDMVIGTNWVIECDGRKYHDNDPQYHKDRRRDLRLRTMGYVVTRLTWEQVFLGWEETRGQLQLAVRRREHRRPVGTKGRAARSQ